MTRLRAVLPFGLGLLVLVAVSDATAATHPVDDSASLPEQPNITMRARPAVLGQQAGSTASGESTVRVVLNTTPWVHRVGRIYMVLPAQPVGPVTVSWSTEGRLLPGALVSGQRALVYAGLITTSRLIDTMTLTIQADARRLGAPRRLDFQFQIDVE